MYLTNHMSTLQGYVLSNIYQLDRWTNKMAADHRLALLRGSQRILKDLKSEPSEKNCGIGAQGTPSKPAQDRNTSQEHPSIKAMWQIKYIAHIDTPHRFVRFCYSLHAFGFPQVHGCRQLFASTRWFLCSNELNCLCHWFWSMFLSYICCWYFVKCLPWIFSSERSGLLNFPADAREWSEMELDLFVGSILSESKPWIVD